MGHICCLPQCVLYFSLRWWSVWCRYWTRPALIFWPPSCRWKIRCQAGLQHCIDTLHHLNAEAANQPVLHASKHQAKSEPSQQSAVLPEMAHVHTPAAQPGIRAEQDANNLANMMWIALEVQLFCIPADFHAFMHLVEHLSLQSLASQLKQTLCQQVRHSCVTQHSTYLNLQHITS